MDINMLLCKYKESINWVGEDEQNRLVGIAHKRLNELDASTLSEEELLSEIIKSGVKS